MDLENREFLKMLNRMEKLTMRIGTVTAVPTSHTINCTFTGDVKNAAGTTVSSAPVMTNIRHLANYSPTVGDVVVLLVDNSKQLFIAIGNI